MRKLKAPRLVTVAIITTITIIFWIFISVYTILTTKAPVTVPPEILEPIDPSLDIGILDQLEKKGFIEEGEVPINISTPTPTLAPAPTSIPSPTPLIPEPT